MRLALEIFLAQSLVILVVAGVAYWSLTEVAKLLAANREITTRTAEALRIEVSLRESMRRASALEERFVVFGDQEYASKPIEVAQEIREGLAQLPVRLGTELERARLREATQHFVAYGEATAKGRRLRAAGDARRAGEVISREAVPAAQRFTLTCERGPGSFTMTGDENRIVQVLVNLIANAVRFTAPGGAVTVRLVDSGADLEAHVEDTGMGIPADQVAVIFDPYRQAHAGHGGTGLGLAVVRAMVDAHGGHVSVDSEEGKGSRFTVILPRQPSGPGARA